MQQILTDAKGFRLLVCLDLRLKCRKPPVTGHVTVENVTESTSGGSTGGARQVATVHGQNASTAIKLFTIHTLQVPLHCITFQVTLVK